MAIIKVNKSEAAQRQIDAAIRMLYAGEDPVAVHTLTMAAFHVVCDLNSKDADSLMQADLELLINPGMESEFWRGMNSLANFLKHADTDPDAVHDVVDEEVNDSILLLTCVYYQGLGHKLTPEMLAHSKWYACMNEGLLRDDVDPKYRAWAQQIGKPLKELNRQEQLKLGNDFISMARNNYRPRKL